MGRFGLEVADVFRRYGEAFRQRHGASLSTAQRRVMTAIEVCRTAALGGHVEHCDHCDHQRISYNSCRNRNCPKCQSLARAEWLEKRESELLDVPYFHIVFTLPEPVAAIAYQNKEQVYDILFRTASVRISRKEGQRFTACRSTVSHQVGPVLVRQDVVDFHSVTYAGQALDGYPRARARAH